MEEKAAGDDDDDEGGLFDEEEMEKGDEFMAVLPWLGAIKEPSNYPGPPPGYD